VFTILSSDFWSVKKPNLRELPPSAEHCVVNKDFPQIRFFERRWKERKLIACSFATALWDEQQPRASFVSNGRHGRMRDILPGCQGAILRKRLLARFRFRPAVPGDFASPRFSKLKGYS
jgi:hypothetical protein